MQAPIIIHHFAKHSGRPTDDLFHQQHEQHLTSPDRPFHNNSLYEDEPLYVNKLVQTLSPRVSLTKTEYLVLVNMRPFRRRHLAAMIEDVDSRFSLEQQNFIRDAVVEILGMKEGLEGNEDAAEVKVLGG